MGAGVKVYKGNKKGFRFFPEAFSFFSFLLEGESQEAEESERHESDKDKGYS